MLSYASARFEVLFHLFLFNRIKQVLTLSHCHPQNIIAVCLRIQRKPKHLLRMRRTLHRLAVLILDAKHCRRDIASVRLHDLDLIADKELVALLNAHPSICSCISDDAKIRIFFDVGIAVVNLCFRRRLSIKETGRKLPVCAV